MDEHPLGIQRLRIKEVGDKIALKVEEPLRLVTPLSLLTDIGKSVQKIPQEQKEKVESGGHTAPPEGQQREASKSPHPTGNQKGAPSQPKKVESPAGNIESLPIQTPQGSEETTWQDQVQETDAEDTLSLKGGPPESMGDIGYWETSVTSPLWVHLQTRQPRQRMEQVGRTKSNLVFRPTSP